VDGDYNFDGDGFSLAITWMNVLKISCEAQPPSALLKSIIRSETWEK
jgi:hypothetical protein